jgi:hypothetical protein
MVGIDKKSHPVAFRVAYTNFLFTYGRGAFGRTVLTFAIVAPSVIVATTFLGRGALGRTVETFEMAMFVATTSANVTTRERNRFVVIDIVFLPLLFVMCV